MADYSQLYPWIPVPEGASGLGLLGSTVQGPLDLTRQIGAHADWEKFQNEARPSQNVEDVRGVQKPWWLYLDKRLNNAITDAVVNAMFK